MTMTLPFGVFLPRFDLVRATKALATLLRDPDDLPQVFVLIEALAGTAPHRLLIKMLMTPSGRQMVREQPDILPILADREGLRALPEGSLGRAYLAFVEAEGITPEGIRDASFALTGASRRAAFPFIKMRMRDTHDVWHAVTGYKGDVLGELSLLAFTLAQNWHPGIALILVAAILKGLGSTDTSLIFEGYKRGRAAAWFPAQKWEDLLARPLVEVRELLSVGSPPVYTPIRTSELRAGGVI